MTIRTEAWVLYPSESPKNPPPGELVCEMFTFDEPEPGEVLVEPVYGCWEGNMAHAVARDPVDICWMRGIDKAVIGNSGVVRVLKSGRPDSPLREGQFCYVFASGAADEFGYMTKALAYDAPNTMGVLAKRTKLPEKCLVAIPENSRFSLQQWSSFSLRFVTAWANWKIAFGCWRLQMTEHDMPAPFVLGWGGGVSVAELMLAKYFGSRVAMVASGQERHDFLRSLGIEPIDRGEFPHLNFDEQRYAGEPDYREHYLNSEHIFLDIVRRHGRGRLADIVVDNIGKPVHRASLKCLARQGIFTTCGWKEGMASFNLRAIECISRHQHIHTHYARYSEGLAATDFAENTDWMAPLENQIFAWDQIPDLALRYERNEISSYFPTFQINPE